MIRTMLNMNGYTADFVNRVVRNFLNNVFSGYEKLPIYGPEQIKTFIKLPYIGDASLKIKGCINTCLKQIRCGGVKVIFTNKFSRTRDKFKIKDRQPKHLKSDLIYRINCSCGRFYIGETARNVLTRFREHMKSSGTGLTEVGQHLRDNPECEITFDYCSILGYESNTYRRKIKESLFIQQFSNGNLLNDQLKSVQLFLFSLPTYQ